MAESFDPDSYLASKGTVQPVEPSVDPLQVASFDPDTYLAGKQSENLDATQTKYGTDSQQAISAIESVARGVTWGASDYALTHSGTPSEDIRGRMEANPKIAFVGNITGGAKALGLGALGTGAKAIGAGTVAKSAIEGAAFGAGNVVSDAALGDPDLNAQKIAAEVGFGALMGGGIGTLAKGIEASPGLFRKAQKAVENPELNPTNVNSTEPVIDPPIGKKPTSLEEMDKMVSDIKKYGGQEDINELPQAQEARDAADRLKSQMQYPITDMQMGSLDSQDARNAFKTDLEMPGKAGETLRNYQGVQKKSLTNVLDNGIKDIAPGYEPTSSALEAGERATEKFTNRIESARDSLGPIIQDLKKTPMADIDHLPGVIDYLTNPELSKRANPKIANMFDTSKPSELNIKSYSTNIGIDKSTYTAVKQAVEALQESPKSAEGLFDIRKGMSQNIDLLKAGDASREITQAKAAMMDYIQGAIRDATSPESPVREIFAQYAKNEEAAQLIEKKFGAEIGSGNWKSLARGKAEENILGKIFKDSETVAAAKQVLGPKDFNELLADHLSTLKEDVTDPEKKIFSSNKFSSKLNKSKYALGEAFAGNEVPFQKIKDAVTLLRIFADDTPKNPSGTASTLVQAFTNSGMDPFKLAHNLAEFGKEKVGESIKAREINNKLSGISDQAKRIDTLKKMGEKVTDKITSGAKAIYNYKPGGSALRSAGALASKKEYEKNVKRIKELSGDQTAMLDHLSNSSDSLYAAAPNITQSLHNTVVAGVQFLNSKIPSAGPQMVLSSKHEPSTTQISKFNKYFQVVSDPISSLDQVKNGMLTNETMEALQTVHPKLLDNMKQSVMEHFNEDKAKSLPYQVRISLAKFLGQPLDEHMMPMNIQSYQLSLTGPQLSNQSAPKRQQQKPSLAGLKELDLSAMNKTRTQGLGDEG